MRQLLNFSLTWVFFPPLLGGLFWLLSELGLPLLFAGMGTSAAFFGCFVPWTADIRSKIKPSHVGKVVLAIVVIIILWVVVGQWFLIVFALFLWPIFGPVILTLFSYSVAALPMFAALNFSGLGRAILLLTGIGYVGALAILPSKHAEKQARVFVSQFLEGDLEGTSALRPRIVRLIGYSIEIRNAFGNLQLICSDLCVSLLQNEGIEAVLVSKRKRYDGQYPNEEWRYKIGSPQNCINSPENVKVRVHKRLPSGECLYGEEIKRSKADVEVIASLPKHKIKRGHGICHRTRQLSTWLARSTARRITVIEYINGEPAIRLQRTQISYRTAGMPFQFGRLSCGPQRLVTGVVAASIEHTIKVPTTEKILARLYDLNL